jgi:hypothetical protein
MLDTECIQGPLTLTILTITNFVQETDGYLHNIHKDNPAKRPDDGIKMTN